MTARIEGFNITETIYQTNETAIYQAVWKQESKNVVIKTFNDEYPSSQEIAGLNREYQIIKRIDVPGVIRVHAFEKYGSSAAMIMESFDAKPLIASIADQKGSVLDLFF